MARVAASIRRSERRARAVALAAPAPAPVAPEEPLEPLLTVDPLTVEVGYDLVELAGSEKPGGLLDRIRGIRRQVALDLGLVVPPVRVRDNLRLGGDEYQILLRGAEVGRNRLPRHRVLAIDPGDVLERVEGEPTRDPAFGIDALWIPETAAERARGAGYTVVDRASVLSTHLSEIVRRHAPELLGRQETQRLLDILAKQAPKLVEELVPERCTVGQVQKVLQALLRERVSIRDLQTICESLADSAGTLREPAQLLARVRQALGRSLVGPWVSKDALSVVTLAPELESELRQMLGPAAGGGSAVADPRFTHSLVHRVTAAIRELPAGVQPVVLCHSPEGRALVRRLTESALPSVPFLSVFEIPDGVRVQALAQVR
jgi:flagellar biosynthesis protein FlhA